jgi:hypothetical protein
MEEQKPDAMFAIVEVMGHQTYAGKLTEQVLAGAGFIRVDVPEIPENGRYAEAQPGFTKLISPASIYAITPCSEEVAVAAARRTRSAPMNLLAIPAAREKVVAATATDDDYDPDDDDSRF